MKGLIQRVTNGNVTVNGKVISQIGKGYVFFIGISEKDSETEADILAEKTVSLRIMSDEQDKMNRSILDAGGEILVVSQFTLLADTSGGRRPSFIQAAKRESAHNLYLYFVDKLKKLGVKNVQTGEFGAYMSVEIINDGPVTIMLDTEGFGIRA